MPYKSREERNKYARAWRANNHDEALARERDWRTKNRDKLTSAQKAWRTKNRPQRILYNKQWQQDLKQQVFNAYGGPVCACCGDTHLEFLCVDHVNGKGN